MPRNLVKHDGSANFGLDSSSEVRLSGWMEQRLSLATWSKPEDAVLEETETAVSAGYDPR